MNKLEELKAATTDRAKVLAWLDLINEQDRTCRREVLDQCASDKEARRYYLMQYDCAIIRA